MRGSGRLHVSPSFSWWRWKTPAGFSYEANWVQLAVKHTKLATDRTQDPTLELISSPDAFQCLATFGYIPGSWAWDKNSYVLNTEWEMGKG